MSDLGGKSIVITGAGDGLGAAYARAAAALGATVVVSDINAEATERVVAEICAAGGRAVAHRCDVRDYAATEALIARCVDEFGAITGLVNNAGIYIAENFVTSNVEQLRQLVEVNVIGVYNCGRAAVGPMLRQGEGSIVNITSGAQAGHPTLSSYGATKGAVASFTYGWALELRETGIRVNSVSPMASTPMTGHASFLPPPDVNSPPVLFFLSDRSREITGQAVRIIGNKLSLMCHPANIAPVLQRDTWSLDSVADAFDETLGAKQVPVGVATYEIASVHVENLAIDRSK